MDDYAHWGKQGGYKYEEDVAAYSRDVTWIDVDTATQSTGTPSGRWAWGRGPRRRFGGDTTALNHHVGGTGEGGLVEGRGFTSGVPEVALWDSYRGLAWL